MKQRVLMRKAAQVAAAIAFSFASLAPISELTAQKKQASCIPAGDGITKTRSNGKKVHLPGLFDDGEMIREIKCLDRRVVVLTTENLTVARDPEKKRGLNEGSTTKYPLSETYDKGLVSYVLDENRAFFLTKDRDLTLLPYENGSSDAVSYGYKFDVSETKLAVENGILFAAPVNRKITYCSFDSANNIACRTSPLDRKMVNGSFFRDSGILHFGAREKNVRISAGQTLDSVKIKG